MEKFLLTFVFGLCLQLCFAQGVFVPPGFDGPIFFDANGQLLKSREGAGVYRIYHLSGQFGGNSKKKSAQGIEIPSGTQGQYYYFEDHYITGELQTQGNLWITKQHEERGVTLYAWKVHLKGECRWYHPNGQLAQVGIYNGSDWYGDQKFYDPEGKLTKVEPGKLLDTYDYSFERNILKLSGFTYTRAWPKGVLPNNTMPEQAQEAPEIVPDKPFNLAEEMAKMPHFSVKNYRPFLGMYEGKTTNLSLQKVTNVNLEITEFVTKESKAMLDIHWFGSISAYTQLVGSTSDNVIFAQGDWIVKGAKKGVITLAAFFMEEEGQIEGFFNVRLFEGDGKVQSCRFKVQKPKIKTDGY